jgi:UDP-3-O-[3-hydroxymyristoyl] glucosamine N-acyltransferase
MKSYSAKEVAELLNSEFIGNDDAKINGVNSLDNALETDLSFVGEKKFIKKMETTKASIIIVPLNFDKNVPEGKALIKCEIPNIAFSKIVNLFAPPAVEYKAGIHPTAIIADSAVIDSSCHVAAYAVIGERTVVGKNTNILSGVVIGPDVKIGSDCLFYPSVVVREYCEIGNNVIIHPNVTIGADGFGYTPTPFGIAKIPQVGIVKIDDEVEIGANSTVDRARFGKTWIKTGVKIDNLVTVGHNATIGEFSILAGQSGVAGSATLGQGVVVASKAAINNHIMVGDGAAVGPCAVVKDDVKPGEALLGYPAVSAREFAAQLNAHKSVKRLRDKVKELEKTLKTLKLEVSEFNK